MRSNLAELHLLQRMNIVNLRKELLVLISKIIKEERADETVMRKVNEFMRDYGQSRSSAGHAILLTE